MSRPRPKGKAFWSLATKRARQGWGVAIAWTLLLGGLQLSPRFMASQRSWWQNAPTAATELAALQELSVTVAQSGVGDDQEMDLSIQILWSPKDEGVAQIGRLSINPQLMV